MSWLFRVLTALTVGFVLIGASITAAAAPDPGGTATANETTTASDGDRMVRQISPTTYIERWDYDEESEVWTITLQSEIPTQLTISEATVMDSEGSRRFNIRRYDIQRGQTTIRFSAPSIDGTAAVTLVTTESLAAGHGVYLQSGSTTDNPFRIFEGIDGLLVGVGVSVSTAFLAAVVLIRRESDGVEVAD
jgi:hypothetical protein